jgi:hypothetical protein
MKKEFFQPTRYNGYGQGKFAPKVSERLSGKNFMTSAYMADVLGLANCATPDSIFNVGVPPCDLKKKKMKGVIFADRGVTFTGAEVASAAAFIAAVKTKTTAARGGRVYPIWDLLNFEDNTGDPATGGIGNLTTATITTSDAVPAFRFGYNGTEMRHTRVSAMASATLDVFFVDEGWAVYGTLKSEGVFGGFNVLQAYGDVTKFVVSDAVNQYSFRVTLGDVTEYRDKSTYVVTNSGITAAVGLVNVVLSKLSNVTNVYKIQAIADGGTNLEPLNGAAIAALTWTATNLQTGAAFVVTSVADDTALDAFTVTLDNAAYTALASLDKVQINGPTAAALSAAGVKPYEMIPVIITKP